MDGYQGKSFFHKKKSSEKIDYPVFLLCTKSKGNNHHNKLYAIVTLTPPGGGGVLTKILYRLGVEDIVDTSTQPSKKQIGQSILETLPECPFFNLLRPRVIEDNEGNFVPELCAHCVKDYIESQSSHSPSLTPTPKVTPSPPPSPSDCFVNYYESPTKSKSPTTASHLQNYLKEFNFAHPM